MECTDRDKGGCHGTVIISANSAHGPDPRCLKHMNQHVKFLKTGKTPKPTTGMKLSTKLAWAALAIGAIMVFTEWWAFGGLLLFISILVLAGKLLNAIDHDQRDAIENTIKSANMTPAEAALYRSQKETERNTRNTMWGTWAK